MNEIKEWLINWFVDNSNTEIDELKQNVDENYLMKGFIDSFGLIKLINATEDFHNISFNEKHFEDKRFVTINGLTEIIQNLASQCE